MRDVPLTVSARSQPEETSAPAGEGLVPSGAKQIGLALAVENSTVVLLECGVDEVGIGSAIGEVYAAACILNPARRINGLRDSKQLTPERRKELSDRIKERALDFYIATGSLEEVNRLNVFGATMLAMQRAVSGLKLKPGIVLIDGNRLPKLPFPARTIIKGDAKVPSISAASILAKVARDEAMLTYHEQFPQYGFASNNGYLTEFHLATLKRFGPCPIHRQNYEPIRVLLAPGVVERQLSFLTPDGEGVVREEGKPGQSIAGTEIAHS